MAISERSVDRLDQTFELILLLIGVISAAIFQYISSTPKVEQFAVLFSMRILFIPIIWIVLIWIFKSVFEFENAKMFLRIYVWTLALLSLLLDLNFFLTLSFPQSLQSILNIFIGLIILIAFFLYLIQRAYAKALTDIPFFKSIKWRIIGISYAVVLAYFTLLIIFYVTLTIT